MLNNRSNRSLLRKKSVNLMTLLAILATTILLPTHAVQASTPSYSWSNWELRVDFPASGAVNALFIVRIGHHVPDGSGGTAQVADIVHTTSVPCTPQGDVKIAPGVAIFHNTPMAPGHILCTLPDYASMVNGLTSGAYTISSSVGVAQPWATAKVAPAPGDPHAGPINPTQNPIFYHPDIQLSTPLGLNPGTAHLHFGFGGNYLTSDFFHADPAGSSLWSGVVHNELFSRADFWSWATYLNPGDLFGLSGIPLVADGTRMAIASSSTASTFSMGTASTTVCIGCNLDAGTYFEGAINRLAVDPGNFSNH